MGKLFSVACFTFDELIIAWRKVTNMRKLILRMLDIKRKQALEYFIEMGPCLSSVYNHFKMAHLSLSQIMTKLLSAWYMFTSETL